LAFESEDFIIKQTVRTRQ